MRRGNPETKSNEILRSAQNDKRPSCHPEQILCHPELYKTSSRNGVKTCELVFRAKASDVSGSCSRDFLKQPISISWIASLFVRNDVMVPSPRGRVWEGVRQVAFTLAEVLITLGIIGIVAAMTMPTLISNHKKKVVVTGIQKNVSLFSQAFQMAEAKKGFAEDWTPCSETFSFACTKNFFDEYLALLNIYL